MKKYDVEMKVMYRTEADSPEEARVKARESVMEWNQIETASMGTVKEAKCPRCVGSIAPGPIPGVLSDGRSCPDCGLYCSTIDTAAALGNVVRDFRDVGLQVIELFENHISPTRLTSMARTRLEAALAKTTIPGGD